MFNLSVIGPGGSREGDILDNLVKNADQRELLSSMLARDKERYRQEDKEIEMKMAEQGIRWVPENDEQISHSNLFFRLN